VEFFTIFAVGWPMSKLKFL
jgi:hypothetical protein